MVTTIEVFLEIGRRCGADLRVIIDDFETKLDTSVLFKCAQTAGIDPATIDVLPRTATVPKIPLRANDVFVAHNWWGALNLRSLLDQQSAAFSRRRPFLYLIQDYDPFFYPFSSTNMAARRAFDGERDAWGVFNSGELHAYFLLQGHRTRKAFVFEPRISAALRPFLAEGPVAKQKRILVYGRPSISRNCYPSVRSGLRLWAERYPRATEWEVVSAGLPHRPLRTLTLQGNGVSGQTFAD